MTYRNVQFGFELTLPSGWTGPGLLKRMLQASNQPEFFGQSGSSLKVAIGPISPVPTIEQQLANLSAIANRYGHSVIDTGTIQVGKKTHATVTCHIPQVGVLKNYSIIFGSTEYFFTGCGALQQCDMIVQSFEIV